MGRFQEATREAIKLRMAIKAISGGGKTYSAMALMSWILSDRGPGPDMTKRIAVIETERGSARRYARGRPFFFSTLELKTYEPEVFVEALRDAHAEGFEGVIIDSLSHEWAGTGGALEQSDIAKKRGGNSFAAWGDITKRHNAVMNAIWDSPLHVIATMRTKTTYEQVEDDNGKKKVKKLGLQPVQRDGIEFEFDLLGDMDASNVMYIEKTRFPAIRGKEFREPGRELGRLIHGWLEDHDGEEARPVEVPPALAAHITKLATKGPAARAGLVASMAKNREPADVQGAALRLFDRLTIEDAGGWPDDDLDPDDVARQAMAEPTAGAAA